MQYICVVDINEQHIKLTRTLVLLQLTDRALDVALQPKVERRVVFLGTLEVIQFKDIRRA
jgi:hypothetical protein